ncbi:MAG: S1/P1 Nuclease [Flavobacteriaceae bacterium]|nr:MAG: S1/P1 Nuclease [Flavobacteriaceae bacterium]
MNILKTLALTLLFLSTSLTSSANNGEDWGANGHRTTGKIAEKYLSKRAKKNIAKLLDGKSLAFVSTFGDDIKSDKSELYRSFYSWHYVNFPFNSKYEDSKKNPKGDLITGIATCIEKIKNDSETKETKAIYLKMLVHLIGDLHQPLHVGRGEDKGGNTIQVQWFKKGTNLHRVWDSDMINHYDMGYVELAANADKLTRKEVKTIQEGTVLDWVYETQKLAIKVYDTAKSGDKLWYNYPYKNFGTVRSQLQKSGIRLAKVLNVLFK